MRKCAQAYLRGLLSPVKRKNGWQLAEEAGERTPYAMQYLLDRASWESDNLRDRLRSYVSDILGDLEAVLVIDETGFLKKGTRSVGVQRHSPLIRRVDDCILKRAQKASTKGFVRSSESSVQRLSRRCGSRYGEQFLLQKVLHLGIRTFPHLQSSGLQVIKSVTKCHLSQASIT